MVQKKLLMIVNPTAGRSKPRGPLFDAAALFSQAGYLLSIRQTESPGDAIKIAAECGEDTDVVVAVGGDGTLNQTISGLMSLEQRPLLGYLPRGSTNDFAASLHISSDPAAAADQILHGQRRALDIGRWNERYFVYVASFGAFTRSSYTAPHPRSAESDKDEESSGLSCPPGYRQDAPGHSWRPGERCRSCG